MRSWLIVGASLALVACNDDGGAALDTTSANDAPEAVGETASAEVASEVAGDASGAEADVAPDETGGGITLHGGLHKGPFVVGSAVSVSLLDGALEPVGQVFNTMTTNDRGEFDLHYEGAGAIAIEGVGYYFNEVVGALSQSGLTLRALFVPSGAGDQHAYVNLITHITSARIKALVAAGTSFGDAVTQAEAELAGELAISAPSYHPGVHATEMNMVGGDSDDNAYLVGVSAVLIQVARDRGGALEARIQEVLNKLAIDFADGVLAPELKAEIQTALLEVDLDAVRAHLAARFAAIGASEAVPDPRRVLDQDHDGRASLADDCPLAADPEQGDKDHDGFGDACDPCPETPCEHGCVPAGAGRAADACVERCAVDEDCTDVQATCVTLAVPVAAGTTDVALCAGACEPLVGCGAGAGCVQFEAAWRCVPLALAPPAEEGAACDAGELCGPGLRCDHEQFAPFACRRVCDPAAGAAGCDGRACQGGLCAPPIGAEGDRCWFRADGRIDPVGTCGSGLACGAGPPCQGREQCCAKAGGAGERCFGDGSCDAGLRCLNAADGMRTCQEVGALDQPCRGDATCDAGLDCTNVGCAGPSANCCVPGAAAGESCGPSRACGLGLVCGATGAACQPGVATCCAAPLAEGADCAGHDVCADGLRCARGVYPFACAANQAWCCVPSGDTRQLCNLDGSCDRADLACVGDGTYGRRYCLPTSGPCGPGESCPDDSICDSGACVRWGQELGFCATSAPCDAGLTCDVHWSVVTAYCPYYASGFHCCVPRGTAGATCTAGGGCDADLSCVANTETSYCLNAGAHGQPCAADKTCDPGLNCANTADTTRCPFAWLWPWCCL